MKNRVELCCHTKMSKLQGLNDVKEYIEEAIKREYKAIAITDTDSTQSFFNAYDYLKANTINKNIKIIYGSEMHFKVSENNDIIYTIYVYVKSQKGLKNLYELISKAYRNVINETPIIYKSDLLKFKDGLLFASIGNKSEVYQNIENTDIKTILDFYDFVGIVPDENNKNINIKINKLCKENNKILIGTSECNFINKEDYKSNEVLNYYKKSNNIEDGNNKYFHSTEELINCFNYLENVEEIVINNPEQISNEIGNINLIPQKACYPKIPFATMILAKKCYDRANELYGKKLPKEVKERIELELHSIEENNFASIYLICSELVEYSNKLGYKVGYRGSVGNSFIAFLSGITNINPLEYNLPFEFLAGKNFDKEPDIDLNFSRKIQSKIFAYLQKKYGKDKVIWCGTVGSLADRTVEKSYCEYINTYEIKDVSNNESTIEKIVGVKRCTGEHPGGVMIIPDDMDITDFCPTEVGEKGHIKTHCDYHAIWGNTNLYKFDILGHDDPTMLHELEKETNINSDDIKLDDKETLKMFLHANDKLYPISTNGIPEFGTTFVKKMIGISKPRNFNDLVCISALSHGTGTWTSNASSLIENEDKKLGELISNRADMYNCLVNHGIDKTLAFDIVEFVRKGKVSKARSLRKYNLDRHKEVNEKWEEYKTIMQKHNIPNWYIESAEKIDYMFPKSHAISYTMNAFKIAWYKVHNPKAFYKIYFKVKSDLDVNDYYCKRQVQRELNILYDLKETQENIKEIDFDYSIEDKIRDLELVLEMFNRGVLKEKTEIKDDYNLINSRAIADYCRSIKHKFNTEELAVLVYRNQRMSIEEKIAKYNELIKNYPDMEVIERINCKHYDSVKTMIKNEIQRLKILNKKFIQDDENSIYTWTEYNKSTQKMEHINDIDHTFRTYKEAFKDIQDYINEYDDTISFRITKKYFNKRKDNIYADYNVENKKIVLVDLNDSNNELLDIDNIFLNIPTPFKKGDILISNSPAMKSYGETNEIFVLDYLCTWRENLASLLAKGNFDSSDMIGYGYYFINDDTTEFIRDHKFNYDSFEYYDGELKGKYRILKDISSFIKGKIGLELFIHAYDYYKNDFINAKPYWYTDEELRLAGMSETDIKKANHIEKSDYND